MLTSSVLLQEVVSLVKSNAFGDVCNERCNFRLSSEHIRRLEYRSSQYLHLSRAYAKYRSIATGAAWNMHFDTPQD